MVLAAWQLRFLFVWSFLSFLFFDFFLNIDYYDTSNFVDGLVFVTAHTALADRTVDSGRRFLHRDVRAGPRTHQQSAPPASSVGNPPKMNVGRY